jgi:hypothetical protein
VMETSTPYASTSIWNKSAVPSKISGSMNGIVLPCIMSITVAPGSTNFERPKSTTHSSNLLFSNILSGFRSQCRIRCS